MARDDHGLGVLAGEQPQLLQRAAEGVWVVRSRRPGPVAELSEGVDRVAGDHQVAVGEAADQALVPRRMARRERQADAAVAEEVERAAEGRVRLDPLAVVDRAVIEDV